MMKWGGARPINFERVSACKPREIQSRLTKFNKLIGKNDAEFIVDEYLFNDAYRISGVNLSFITKHLYFIKPEKFLIYDRFMQNLHVAMLLDSDSDLISHYFRFSEKEKVFKIRSRMHGKAYADFIERFKILFAWVNEELARRSVKSFNSLGELEAFLFGSPNVRNLSNPRVMIVNYIFENKNL